MQKEIRIVLADDTAQFLEMTQTDTEQSINDFINSLIRQERFRKGFPAYFKKSEPPRPITSRQEQRMLFHSGLLPFIPPFIR